MATAFGQRWLLQKIFESTQRQWQGITQEDAEAAKVLSGLVCSASRSSRIKPSDKFMTMEAREPRKNVYPLDSGMEVAR
eukprot:353615-Chlamydomonas_euryale.AAC.16